MEEPSQSIPSASLLDTFMRPARKMSVGDGPTVGLLTREERMVKVQRYLSKKRERKNKAKVRYSVRQDQARTRYRFQGRFMRAEELAKLPANYILDRKNKKVIKPIFDIERS